MNNPHEHATIRRDNGTRFATVNDDCSRVFLVMYQPNGYSGQEAVWLTTIDETKKLIAALQGRVDKLEAMHAAAAAAA